MPSLHITRLFALYREPRTERVIQSISVTVWRVASPNEEGWYEVRDRYLVAIRCSY